MTRVAAIDIGTNSTRLLVADVDGARRRRHDRPVAARDAHHPARRRASTPTARLRPDAIERTVAVLREYGEAIERLGRDARARRPRRARRATRRNRDDFFDPATEALRGVRPELLSGRGGGRALVPRRDGRDCTSRRRISWSTSVAARPSSSSAPTKPEGLISIDIGCVRLTEQFLHGDPPEPEELSNAVSAVRDHLADVDREVPGVAGAATLVGLAGTVTTLAAIELGPHRPTTPRPSTTSA